MVRGRVFQVRCSGGALPVVRLAKSSGVDSATSAGVVAKKRLSAFRTNIARSLLNIMMNARDALLEKRTDEARVTVSISKEGGTAVVAIADNAGGIAEEVMAKSDWRWHAGQCRFAGA